MVLSGTSLVDKSCICFYFAIFALLCCVGDRVLSDQSGRRIAHVLGLVSFPVGFRVYVGGGAVFIVGCVLRRRKCVLVSGLTRFRRDEL